MGSFLSSRKLFENGAKTVNSIFALFHFLRCRQGRADNILSYLIFQKVQRYWVNICLQKKSNLWHNKLRLQNREEGLLNEQ